MRLLQDGEDAVGKVYADGATQAEGADGGLRDEVALEERVAPMLLGWRGLQVQENDDVGERERAADDFLYDLLETLDETERVDAETAQNAVSMSFEYGLLLARVSRSAALVLRNAVNRSLEDAMRAPPPDAPPPEGGDAPVPSASPPEGEESAPPFESLQELAAEMMAAYEADVGFGE